MKLGKVNLRQEAIKSSQRSCSIIYGPSFPTE